jgi:hypothetical protein
MKKYFIYFIQFLGVSLCVLSVSAQRRTNLSDVPVAVSAFSSDMFEKGQSLFSVEQKGVLSRLETKYDGQSSGYDINYGLDLNYAYFIADNHAIVGELDYEREKHFGENDYDNLFREKMLFGGYMYAHQMNDFMGLFGSLKLGIGSNKQYFENPGSETDPVTSIQSGIKIEVGSHIQLRSDIPVYVTPTLGYKIVNENFDYGSELNSKFRFSIKLFADLNNEDYYCGSGIDKSEIQNELYNKGDFFIDGFKFPGINVGSTKFEHDNGTTSKSKYNHTGIDLNGGYYFVDNFAVEGGVGFGSSVSKPEMLTSKSSSLMFSVGARAHFPSDDFVNNAYGFARAKIGNSNSSFNYTNTPASTSKLNDIGYCVGVGYNYPIAKFISIYSDIHYESIKSTNRESDQSYTNSGVTLNIGSRVHF